MTDETKIVLASQLYRDLARKHTTVVTQLQQLELAHTRLKSEHRDCAHALARAQDELVRLEAFLWPEERETRERVKLEQAEGLIERGEVAQATKLLDEIATSDIPAHLDRARDLQERLNDQAHAQLTASKRAEIARARAMISEGRRSEAATTLAAVIASSPSQDVAREAHTMMSATGTSWLTQFRDALKTPWLIQVLTGLVILAGLWVGLHLLRDGWRWWIKRAASRAGKERVWRFVGMGEDPGGARDAILDAIRRVPREVKDPIWTPTRLLLYPIPRGWEVWEDFAVHE